MYPASFEYHAPSSLSEAVALLEQYGDDGKVIAGSQSLIPLMKLRFVQPAHVIDLRRVPGMTGIREAGSVLEIGAMTTHRELEGNELVRARLPVMAEAAGNIGDRQVRNKGTIGGSLAHADPSADWPAVTIALDASVQIAGKRGERSVKVEELIVGPLTTVLEPGELITLVRVPLVAGRQGSAYEKAPHPASRFAVVGVAAMLMLDGGGRVQAARVAITGIGPSPSRARAVENALEGTTAGDEKAIAAAAERVTDGIEVRDDLIGPAAYRRNLANVYARRALTRAAERARR